MPAAATMPALLDRFARQDGPRPLVTWYDDATGDRAELSAATLHNAVAKTANLLRDGLDLGAGARLGICLPAHWQYPVWLAAAWAAGAVVVPVSDLEDPSRAVATLARTDLAVVAGDLVAACATRVETAAVSLHPLGLPDGVPLPAGVIAAAVEVRAMGDAFTPARTPAAADPAVAWPDGPAWTQGDLLARAGGLAADIGLPAGGRLLVTVDLATPAGLLAALAVPLVTGGSVVLASHEDPAARAARQAAERIDAVLAAERPGD